MFEKVIKALVTFGSAADTFSDRLSSKYTTSLLLLFCVLVSTKQYVGSPVTCWCPSNYAGSHVDFTNIVCWVTNTYYYPFNNRTGLLTRNVKRLKFVNYYQWIPMILIAQAAFFMVPKIFWKALHPRKGMSVMSLIESAYELQTPGAMDSKKREDIMNYVVKNFTRFLIDVDRRKQMYSFLKTSYAFSLSARLAYLSILFILTKMMYLLNVCGQLFILNLIFTKNTKNRIFGVQIWSELARDTWSTDIYFPRVTMCDFKVRRVGVVHKETVQCALPVNLFNEKVYIFIWCWFCIVSLIAFLSLIKWLFLIVSPGTNTSFIYERIIAMELINNSHEKNLRLSEVSEIADDSNCTANEENKELIMNDFVKHFLRRDGVLIMRLLGEHATDLIASETIVALFECYKNARNSYSLSAKDKSTLAKLKSKSRLNLLWPQNDKKILEKASI